MLDCPLQLTQLVLGDPLELLFLFDLGFYGLCFQLKTLHHGLLLKLLLLVLLELCLGVQTVGLDFLLLLRLPLLQVVESLLSLGSILSVCLVNFGLVFLVFLLEAFDLGGLLSSCLLVLLHLHCKLGNFRFPDPELFVERLQLGLAALIVHSLLKLEALIIVLLLQLLDLELVFLFNFELFLESHLPVRFSFRVKATKALQLVLHLHDVVVVGLDCLS